MNFRNMTYAYLYNKTLGPEVISDYSISYGCREKLTKLFRNSIFLMLRRYMFAFMFFGPFFSYIYVVTQINRNASRMF